jgi:hypothetical protein
VRCQTSTGAFDNRDVLVLTIGYTATIWGTAGLRQWIVVFLAFCAAHQGGDATQGWSMLITGALVGLLGVPAGLYGNELSLRFGLRATAMGVFLLSTLVNALFGFAAMLPYSAVVALAMVAGFVVQGNFSNLTSGLLAVAEPRLRGTIVAVLVHRFRRWVHRYIVVWPVSRLVRRNGADGGLGSGVRHLRGCLPDRCYRNRISVARFGIREL